MREDTQTVVIGSRSMDAMLAEWKAWMPANPREKQQDPVPAGGITANEYAKLHRIDQSSARRRLLQGVESGEVVPVVCRRLNSLGKLVATRFFVKAKKAVKNRRG